jgi:hypothetical protein
MAYTLLNTVGKIEHHRKRIEELNKSLELYHVLISKSGKDSCLYKSFYQVSMDIKYHQTQFNKLLKEKEMGNHD